MSYRFRRKETIRDAFRRIVQQQTAGIVAHLADQGPDIAERIHDTRRRIKKLRALLRIVWAELEKGCAEREDNILRDIARELSKSRDASVVLDTFEPLATEIVGGGIQPIRTLLKNAETRTRTRALTPEKLASFATRVRTCGHRLALCTFEADGWIVVGPSIIHSYRQTRALRSMIKKEPAPELIHQWRRQSKRLLDQLTLLRKALPKALAQLTVRLRKFTELLGEHHDLHLLRLTLADYTAQGIEAAAFPPLQAALDARLASRLKRIRRASRELFTLPAKEFAALLHAAWKAWA